MMVEVREILQASDIGTIPASDLINILSAELAGMPEEVRHTAVVRMETYGDYASATLTLNRNETEAERSARKARETADRSRYEKEREENEKREYERLRRKFKAADAAKEE